MKWSVTSFLSRVALFFLVLPAAVTASHAGPDLQVSAKAKPPEAKTASTNVVVIPKSVFTFPPTQKDGRDPFFPESIRIYRNSAVNTNEKPSAVILKLDGISGTREHPLVMINGHTFGLHETAAIPTTSGKIKVHVIEISTNSTIVEVNGVPRELRLREEGFHIDAEGSLKATGKPTQ